jgi:hypothetical protein
MSLRLDSKVTQSLENIYYDLQVYNNTNSAQNLSFFEKRSQYFLGGDKTPVSAYSVAVIRFCIDSNLPFMTLEPLIDGVNTDVNKLVYSFTMTYKTYVFQQYLTFIPQNTNLTAPPLSNQNIEAPYYWLYDAQSFIDIVNTGLVNCWNGLNALVIAGGDTLNNNAPNINIEMNPTTYIMTLNADIAQYDQSGSLVNPISVYINSELHTYLKPLRGTYGGYSNTLGRDVLLTIKNNNNTNIYTGSNGVNYIQSYTEYSVGGVWNMVDVVTVNTSLPILSAYISAPNINEPFFLSSVALSNTEKQLSDFNFGGYDVGNATLTGGQIAYTPTAQYRYISLDNASPLDTVFISFGWKSKRGNYYAYSLDVSQSASIKLLFSKL